MKHPINILMDDRERSSAVYSELAAMEGVSVDILRLSVGDYQADGRLLYERKTLHDFAVSVIDGRLFKQMTQLAIAPLKGVLILEGRSRDLQRNGIRREALQGALITTSLTLSIPVLRSMEPGETARLMVYAARQIKLAVAGGLPRSGYRPKGKRKQQLYILQGLPGVGPKRAEQLLDRFGSIQDVINASSAELTSVNGIGQNTAQNIKWAVCEPVVGYGDNMEWMPEI